MTRTAAREIAIQICYASLLSGTPVDEVTDALFAPEYFATLSEENDIFHCLLLTNTPRGYIMITRQDTTPGYYKNLREVCR